MTELNRTVNNVNDLSTAQSNISSLQDSVKTNTTNITTLQSEVVSINAPNFFWFTDPTLSGTEDIYNPIPWGSIVYLIWTQQLAFGHALQQGYGNLSFLFSMRIIQVTLAGASTKMAKLLL